MYLSNTYTSHIDANIYQKVVGKKLENLILLLVEYRKSKPKMNKNDEKNLHAVQEELEALKLEEKNEERLPLKIRVAFRNHSICSEIQV